MVSERCPVCNEDLNDYGKYMYCFRCSRQFKKKLFGKGLKEVPNTIAKDQTRAMGR